MPVDELNLQAPPEEMVVRSYGVCNGVQQENLLDVTNMVVYLDESGVSTLRTGG